MTSIASVAELSRFWRDTVSSDTGAKRERLPFDATDRLTPVDPSLREMTDHTASPILTRDEIAATGMTETGIPTMSTVAPMVVNKAVAELATEVALRLSSMRIPEIEHLYASGGDERVTIWAVFSAFPLAHADEIYAIESGLILAGETRGVRLRVVSRHGQDLAAIEDIPADSMSIRMAL